MDDVAGLKERTEQSWRWLGKLEAGMKPEDWGEFLPWLYVSENRTVFLECERETFGRPTAVTDHPLEARLADVIPLFAQRT